MLQKAILAVGMLMIMGIPAWTQETVTDPVELTFGVYSSDKATVMYTMFIPIVRYMQESVEATLQRPVDIEIKIFRSYDEGINALVKGDVDFVRFGPSSYILAKEQNPNISLLAMESKNGKKRFKGMIFVAKDSPIERLQDIKGKRFAFGDHNSTIGRFLAQAELVKAGIHARDLKEFAYLGRHDKVVKAVLLGDYDVGSAKESTFKHYNQKGELRVLKPFNNVTKPWIAREGLEGPVCQALTETLLHLTDKAILAKVHISEFAEATDGDYQFVREGMKIAQAFSPLQVAQGD